MKAVLGASVEGGGDLMAKALAADLPVRRSGGKGKRPFGTQLQGSTIVRLEWIKSRGFIIWATVDNAVNAWLDTVGVPRPDESGEIPDLTECSAEPVTDGDVDG
ncbi:hypothetical protein [Nocardia sp. NPDC046763]|uniref:hypothetical protein n=1 Tax=Nocardia sp. NPDC046763 TaxID=3155256 RepID=UPI0033D5DC1D